MGKNAAVTCLIEVEDQIKFADIVEVLIEHLNKVVYGLQVAQVVVIDINTDAEVEPCIPSVDDLKVPELRDSQNRINKKTFKFQKKFPLNQSGYDTSTKFVCLASLTVTTA